jgi:hypothetical protein
VEAVTKRATFSQAELRRAMKAAREEGYRLEIDGTVMRFLPIDPNAPSLSPDQTDSDWSKKLAQWRRSA